MKKPKLSLGPDGIKGVFIRHVEKIVFGVAILLVVLFVASGFRLESALKDKTPPELETLAASAVQHIERPTADALREERIPRNGRGGQYDARVVDLGNVTPNTYETPIPWDAPLGQTGVKREDPEIFPPVQLEITGLTGPLCVTGVSGETPLADLENAERSQKKRRSRPSRSRGRGRAGYGAGDYGQEGRDAGYGMEPGSDYERMEGAGYGAGGATRGTGGRNRQNTGPPRKYDPSQVKGYRPSGVAAGGEGGSYGGGEYDRSGDMDRGYGAGGRGSRGRRPTAKTAHVMAVKALAPYRKQADEFKRVLSSAVGYDPRRDTPRIVFFQAQRADVTDDPSRESAELEWRNIMNPKRAVQVARERNWHGVMQEVADPAYVNRNATMPAPPIMLRDMEAAMLHTEVPKGTRRPGMRRRPEADAEREAEEEDTEMPLAGESLPGGLDRPGGGGFPGRGGFSGGGFPGSGRPGGAGGMYGLGEGGAGYGMESGYGEGYGESYGGGYGESYGEGYGGDYGGQPGMGYGAESEMGYGGGMGSGGYGGDGYGMGRMSTSAEPVQYKLVRFFDTDVQPDRVYRYRVRLFVEDPNNPNTDRANGPVRRPPRRRTLSMEVLQRLKEQEADPDQQGVYYVTTDWSEASEPVSLPSTARAYAGEVSPTRYSRGAGGVKIRQSEPSGTICPVVWNDRYAVDISKEVKAYRGAVLNVSGEFEVLDPVTLIIKLLDEEGCELDSQLTVIDMFGGHDLPGNSKHRVSAIGEFLLIDKEGNFKVRNELADHDEFQRFTLADEVEGAGSMGGYGGGYPGGEPGSYGQEYGDGAAEGYGGGRGP